MGKEIEKVSSHIAIKYISQLAVGYKTLYEMGIVVGNIHPCGNILYNKKNHRIIIGNYMKYQLLKYHFNPNMRYDYYTYYSPKQIYASKEIVNSKDDVWSVGFLLFELLIEGYGKFIHTFDRHIFLR